MTTKGKGSKRARIGSDEYTMDLERRVNELEAQITKFSDLYSELKKKDELIAKLESEVESLKKSVCGVTDDVTVTGDVPVDDAEDPPLEQHEDLIIGDSIVDSLDPVIINPSGGTTIVCIRGGTPDDIARAFVDISKKKTFKRIVVHVGANLVPKFSPAYVADRLVECMLRIKQHAPHSKVAYSSILPKIADSFLPGIHSINQRVIQSGTMGPRRVRYGYCDTFSHFVDRNGRVDPSHLGQDGIHLSKSGASIFNWSLKRLIDSGR